MAGGGKGGQCGPGSQEAVTSDALLSGAGVALATSSIFCRDPLYSGIMCVEEGEGRGGEGEEGCKG